MNLISEERFADFCANIKADRASICQHNPLGTDDEILLWMLLGVTAAYLSLTESEMPCFTGKPDAETYRQAIKFVLRRRKTEEYETDKYLDELIKNNDY